MRAVVLFCVIACFSTLGAQAAQPDGLYLMTRMIMGSSLELKGWYFKNGQVTSRPVGNIASFDFKAAGAKNPGETGTYLISGKQMTITWANGKQSKGDYEPGDHNCFYWDMGSFCPAAPFGKGVKLDGTFEGGASAGYGNVANVTQLTLSGSGSYKLDGVGSIKSEVSSNSQLYAGASGSETGTYDINGTTLLLKSSGGKTREVLTFPYDDGSKGAAPRRLFFDAIMMKRIK